MPWMTNAQIAVGTAHIASCSGLDVNAVLLEEALDEQDRADGDEDVLAEEERDVVDRRGVCADAIRACASAARRTSFSAAPSAIGAIERPHHLRMPAERGEAERGGDLPDREVGEQHADVVAARNCRDERSRARSLSPARSSRPITGSTSHTIATYRLVDERLAERGDDVDGPEPAGEPSGEPATVTTSSGFTRRTNPTTTITMPMSVSIVSPPCIVNAAASPKLRRRMRRLQARAKNPY